MLLTSSESCLLIIDVQERLVPVMHAPNKVITGCAILMRAANLCSVPIIVSEQYAKGLGQTVVDLQSLAPHNSFFGKTVFGCAADAGIMERIAVFGRRQILIAGVEAHVCVLQSALGMREKGFNVFIASDACSSRRLESEQAAYSRMAMCGVHIVTIEMAIFEWIGNKIHPAFKEVQQFIK